MNARWGVFNQNLLNDICDSNHKLKDLWIEIYENSLNDRENAQKLFDSILSEIDLNPTNHAIYGAQASKYLERLCKTNEQLLKLSEVISNETEVQTEINSNDLFNRIEEDT